MNWKELPIVKSFFDYEIDDLGDLIPIAVVVVILGLGFSAMMYFLTKFLFFMGIIGFMFFVAYLVYNFLMEKK